jgi:hypothetical protein
MSGPQLPREVRRRLAIIQHAGEVTGNVAMTCRYYGISRRVYYRYEDPRRRGTPVSRRRPLDPLKPRCQVHLMAGAALPTATRRQHQCRQRGCQRVRQVRRHQVRSRRTDQFDGNRWNRTNNQLTADCLLHRLLLAALIQCRGPAGEEGQPVVGWGLGFGAVRGEGQTAVSRKFHHLERQG